MAFVNVPGGDIPGIAQILIALEKGGLFGFVLPFIFIFAIAYAVTSKSIFSDNKKVALIVSLVLSLYVMIWSPFATFLQTASQYTAMGLTAVLFGAMVVSLATRGGWKYRAFDVTILSNAWGWGWPIIIFVGFFTAAAYLNLNLAPVWAYIRPTELTGLFLVLLFFYWTGRWAWLYTTISGKAYRRRIVIRKLEKEYQLAIRRDEPQRAAKIEERLKIEREILRSIEKGEIEER